MRLAGIITRKSVERFVTTVVNQLTHVANCLRHMNVACVHRVIVLACYFTGRMYCTVIKVDLHGGHPFLECYIQACIKGHHIAMASACSGVFTTSYFSWRRTSTYVDGWSSS